MHHKINNFRVNVLNELFLNLSSCLPTQKLELLGQINAKSYIQAIHLIKPLAI